MRQEGNQGRHAGKAANPRKIIQRGVSVQGHAPAQGFTPASDDRTQVAMRRAASADARRAGGNRAGSHPWACGAPLRTRSAAVLHYRRSLNFWLRRARHLGLAGRRPVMYAARCRGGLCEGASGRRCRGCRDGAAGTARCRRAGRPRSPRSASACGTCSPAQAAAIVTNPVAKNVLYRSGFPEPGHTEYPGPACSSKRPAHRYTR